MFDEWGQEIWPTIWSETGSIIWLGLWTFFDMLQMFMISQI
jgi:hypothetical protein